MEFVHDALILISETYENTEYIVYLLWAVLTLNYIEIYL